MNRAQRRAASRTGLICEHGHAKKTDGQGKPLCPHRCGFPPEKVCTYCGRVGTKQYEPMGDGWRCSSPNNCQNRTRAHTRIGGGDE